MSDAGGDFSGFSLLELFQAEVGMHATTLDEGLVELEGDPTNAERLEALMRAAHSIKGAARIVGLDPAVKLAHAMEDCFVAAQAGTLTLSPAAIDALLAGADTLRRIGELGEADAPGWFETHADELSALVERIEAAGAGDAPAPSAPAAPIAVDAPDPDAEPAAAPPATDPATTDRPLHEVDVRVHAESLGRMLAFAGESVVEARRLASYADSMDRLKRALARMAKHVDRMQAQHSGTADEPALDALRAQLTDVRRLLGERLETLELAARRSEDLAGRLYHEVLRSRMRPFGDGVGGFPRLVRDVAKELGKRVRLTIVGRDVPVDRDILARLDAPLGHMLRNALDHGLETPDERRAAGKPEEGTLRLEARHAAGMLEIELSDDGRGIEPEALRAKIVERELIPPEIAGDLSVEELLEFLFLPGFSTSTVVSELSGRGVGLDVVHTMVKEAGGVIRTASEPGSGTRFLMVLPITRSVIRAALVSIGGQPFAFPLSHVERLIRVPTDALHEVEGRQHFAHEGGPVGLVPATEVLGLPTPGVDDEEIDVVLLASSTDRYGLVVDRFLGEQDLVVRPLDARLGDVAMISAAALDEEGDVVLIMDVHDLLRSIDQLLHEGRMRSVHVTARERLAVERRKRVLVVDDSITVREVERNLLTNRGYEVDVAVDGSEAWKTVRANPYDLIITDVDMPRMDGIELVRRIKQDASLRHLPVMIVSYKDREEDRLRGLEAGADAYLTKSSFHDEAWIAAVVDLVGEPTA
ncbi:MAG: hybrid sensor histidine kinase/response regulator [Planctomycetota bacterium]|nr:hybrid sensor histidine kinase/response regulator [Planctomycetota bacterium]